MKIICLFEHWLDFVKSIHFFKAINNEIFLISFDHKFKGRKEHAKQELYKIE